MFNCKATAHWQCDWEKYCVAWAECLCDGAAEHTHTHKQKPNRKHSNQKCGAARNCTTTAHRTESVVAKKRYGMAKTGAIYIERDRRESERGDRVQCGKVHHNCLDNNIAPA